MAAGRPRQGIDTSPFRVPRGRGVPAIDPRGVESDRGGTGQKRQRYYYYVRKNLDCRLRVPASEIEGIVLERIRILASEPDILAALVAETDGLLNQLAGMDGTDGKTLVAQKLDALTQRRQELQEGIAEVATTIETIRRQAVDETVVRDALTHIGGVYEGLPPYRRTGLIRLVLDSAQVSETELRLVIRGRLPGVVALRKGVQSGACPEL